MKPKEKSDVVNNGAPIKVRFPSVREKIKVLQACRNATKSLQDKGITTIEDFTEKVRIQHHPGPVEQFWIWLGSVTLSNQCHKKGAKLLQSILFSQNQ